jgi:hypothetical protein
MEMVLGALRQKIMCDFKSLTRLREFVLRERPELWPENCFLYHDNVPDHDALRVSKLLAKKSVTKIDRPPYSPDLAP